MALKLALTIPHAAQDGEDAKTKPSGKRRAAEPRGEQPRKRRGIRALIEEMSVTRCGVCNQKVSEEEAEGPGCVCCTGG